MDKATFLAKRELTTENVELGFGTVVLRAATRAELKTQITAAQSGKPGAEEKAERDLLAAVFVDPVLTPEEVGQWLEVATASEVDAVQKAFAKLCGIEAGALKAAYAQFRG